MHRVIRWPARDWRADDGWRMVLGLAAGGAATCVASAIWAVVTPAGPVGEWRPAALPAMPIADRLALFQRFDPFDRRAAGQPAEAVTDLQLTLSGTRVNQGGGGGSAILAGPDGVQQSYAVGDEVLPGVRLVGVAFDHVALDRGGARETLYLDQSVPATNVGASSAGDPAAAAAATDQPASLIALSPAMIAADLDLVPRNVGGRVTGLTVRAKGSGAALRALGLNPGDVVRRVDGRPVSGAADAATLAARLVPGSRLTLEVERGANVVPVAIILPQGGTAQ